MSPAVSWFFLALLALAMPIFAVIDRRAKSQWLKLGAKSFCSLLFVLAAGAAMLGRAAWQASFPWFAAAFLLGASGDALLDWPGLKSIIPGLLAFFVGHAAFAAAFSLRWGLAAWDIVPYAVLAGGALLALVKAPGMHYGGMKLPVAIYALALSAMAAKAASGVYLAGGAGAWLAAAGGLLFFASDIVLAFSLFNERKATCLPVLILAFYYGGQGLLAASLNF